MSEIDLLVEDFLAQKKIAVVGVSDRRETGCNLAYRRFKGAGYEVTAVNPRLTEFFLVEMKGFEPSTSTLPRWRSTS